jgi:membrane associated rhomboid family serine protease
MSTTPWVLRLMIANLVVFMLTGSGQLPTELLALRPMYVLQRPWTPFTYMFVHAPGLAHIGFNMLSLWIFGPQVERRLGGPTFLSLYILSGLGGAALSFFTPTAAIVGASGAVYGVVGAFARLWPNQKILFYFIPIEARVYVLLTALYSLWAGTVNLGDGVAHYAHLGGYVGAFLFLQWIERNSARTQFKRRLDKAMYGAPAEARPATPEWGLIRREGLHPLNLEELDRIEKKISEQGSASLTPDERAFLHRLSSR